MEGAEVRSTQLTKYQDPEEGIDHKYGIVRNGRLQGSYLLQQS